MYKIVSPLPHPDCAGRPRPRGSLPFQGIPVLPSRPGLSLEHLLEQTSSSHHEASAVPPAFLALFCPSQWWVKYSSPASPQRPCGALFPDLPRGHVLSPHALLMGQASLVSSELLNDTQWLLRWFAALSILSPRDRVPQPKASKP